MQGRAELRLVTSNKHMVTLFMISLWHPLILESPWVRLCLIQQTQKVRDEEHKAKCHQCSKRFWPAGTEEKVFCCCFLEIFFRFCLFKCNKLYRNERKNQSLCHTDTISLCFPG